MTRKGPLFTLLGGGVLAAALLAASVSAATGGDDPVAQPVAGAGVAEAPEPPASSPEPEPESEPTEDPAPEPEPAAAVTYVGYVDGGDASVAIVVTGDEATAYVCDGAEVEAWLRGAASDGELRLDSDEGELVGRFDEAAATGRTTVAGEQFTFTIEQVDAPEGLYQFASTVVGGAEVDGGWIVLPDGTQVGVTTVDGVAGPAPELDPRTGEVRLRDTVVVADRVG